MPPVLPVFAFTQGVFFVVVCGTTFIPATILTAIVRLYRESVYNVIDLVSVLAFV